MLKSEQDKAIDITDRKSSGAAERKSAGASNRESAGASNRESADAADRKPAEGEDRISTDQMDRKSVDASGGAKLCCEHMDQRRKDLPVAVFDSGFGGISVLREIVRILPGEDIWFYGDSANAPYGTKTSQQVRELTLHQIEKMYRKGIKAVVIACNTATSAAITALRERYTDIPIVGIEPALKPAASISEHPFVLVMATPGTVAGEKFRHLLQGFGDKADVQPLGCPGLMEYVERGELDSPDLHRYLRELLAPYRKQKIDAIVLGCTHYPFLRKAIAQEAGEQTAILDGSEGTARELARRLKQDGLLSGKGCGGTVRFEMSLPGREDFCRQLLTMKL